MERQHHGPIHEDGVECKIRHSERRYSEDGVLEVRTIESPAKAIGASMTAKRVTPFVLYSIKTIIVEDEEGNTSREDALSIRWAGNKITRQDVSRLRNHGRGKKISGSRCRKKEG